MSRHTNALVLRYLVVLSLVGRTGSFSRAAEELDITQSAISQQIKRLEELVGEKLVERPGGPNPVSLTAAGHILLGHGEAIIARLDSALADLKALSDGESGELRIGCYQSVATQFLPGVLRKFSNAWPKVAVKFIEAENDLELLRLVESGKLDVTFIVYPMIAGSFAHCELFDDPYVVAVSKDSDLGRDGKSIHPRELAGHPIITYAQMRKVHSIEQRIGRPELSEQIVLRSNNNGTILGLVAAGVGVAVISRLSIDPFRSDIRTVALAQASPRTIGIAWHRDRYRSPPLDAFVHTAQREGSFMSQNSSA